MVSSERSVKQLSSGNLIHVYAPSFVIGFPFLIDQILQTEKYSTMNIAHTVQTWALHGSQAIHGVLTDSDCP